MNVCPVWFCERGYKTNNIIESSKQVITKKNCNYVDYKWSSLVTEPCQDYSCETCFHHSCQNDYDTERYADGYDKMHGLYIYIYTYSNLHFIISKMDYQILEMRTLL